MQNNLSFNFHGALILALVLQAVCVAPLHGQAVANAQVSGVIFDPAGARVPDASVTVRQTDTGFSRRTSTDSNGSYVIPNLPVGPYTLEVSTPGFANYVRKGILLSVGNNVSINVTLQLASVQQQVEVTADASMVESHDTSVSQVIDQQRVVELPLNGRQATSLILLSGASAPAPHFVGSKTYGAGDIEGSSSISIAGGQGNWTNYLMDGGDNNHPYANVNLPFPFPDAIQEFSVQTNGLSARYGLHPGGAVNIVTKSGTNSFHGNVFEFLRNGDLNARNFFASTHDSLKRNQFGGTIGGPIQKDSVFFFFGYQGTRIRTAPPQTISYAPTQAVLNGDFSQLASAACQSSGKPRTIVNPTTGQPFPNSFVSPSLFNEQALGLLKYVPVSNDPCGRLVYGIPSPQGENQFLGRTDWTVNSKHALFARYFIADLTNPPVFNNNLLLTSRSGVNQRSQSVVLGETYSISPQTLNSAHAAYTRMSVHRGPTADDISPASVGIKVFAAVPNYTALGVSGYFNIGCGSCAPAAYTTNTMQVADDVDVIRGRHHISFGANYIHNRLDYANVYLNNGTWSFNGQFSKDALVDFLLGRANSFTQANTAAANLRQDYVGLYVQDSVKVTPGLEFHIGLRWEPFIPATDKFDRINHFDPAAFANDRRSQVYTNAPPGVFFVGDPGVDRRFGKVRLADLAPRVGFAWDPSGSGRQTVRASYSMFYDQPMLNYSSHPGQGPPWGNTIAIPSPAGGLTDPFLGYEGGNPFPTPFPPPGDQAFPLNGSYTNVPYDIHPTYMRQWNLSYQRQIADWLFSATYLGNKTAHLWTATEQNPAVYIPGQCGSSPCSTTSNTTQRRVLYLQNPTTGAYYSNIALTDDGANAEYNGLLLSARHRFSSNYTLLANYTYSHCISSATFTGELGGPGYQNPYDRNADRGNCEFDLRHVFNLSMVTASPHFNGVWADRLLGGWQVAPLLSMRSGTWFSPATGVDNSLTGVGRDRPDVMGDPYVRNTSSLQWLDPAAFVPNAIGTFGNAGAFSLVGPGHVGFDLGITRALKVRESQKLEIRFEFFNVVNKTNFANPVSNRRSATFGKIQGAGEPRIIQVAMKYYF